LRLGWLIFHMPMRRSYVDPYLRGCERYAARAKVCIAMALGKTIAVFSFSTETTSSKLMTKVVTHPRILLEKHMCPSEIYIRPARIMSSVMRSYNPQ
jgi:hypothetical protein